MPNTKSVLRSSGVRRIALPTILMGSLLNPKVVSGDELLVGMGRAEITPPVGLATGGHGPSASIARGQLTRLYARAFYFKALGDPILLVSVDAFAVPHSFRAGLQSELKKAGVIVPSASIVVAATHTHHGPGNFLQTRLYNENGSAVSGYLPELHAYIFRRVLQATYAAIGDAKPSSVEIRNGTLPLGLVRNRSPRTFMLNPRAVDLMNGFDLPDLVAPRTAEECSAARIAGEPEADWNIEECPRLRAIDRTIRVLRIMRASHVVGGLVFAAVHPTVLPASAPVYSGDFIGIAMRRLELDYGDQATFGFFNGPEGDIVPRRPQRDLLDLWQHAESFKNAVTSAALIGTLETDGVQTQSREYFARPGESRGGFVLSDSPAPGVATLGGAEGDRTPFYDLGWRERVTALRSSSDQGVKLRALDSKMLPLPGLTWVLAPKSSFSQALPLSYIRFGQIELMAAPTEMSTATGALIREATESGPTAGIIGLGNDYASYTATSHEYEMQDYMGASTFWGPDEAQLFAGILSDLKRGPLTSSARPVKNPGFLALGLAPYRIGEGYRASDTGVDLIVRNRHGHPARKLPSVSWEECSAAEAYMATRLRTVEIWQNHTRLDEDSAGRILVMLVSKEKKKLTWVAIWVGALAHNQLPAQIEFRITTPYASPLIASVTPSSPTAKVPGCQTQ